MDNYIITNKIGINWKVCPLITKFENFNKR
jgi:hypothetical protein